MISYILQLIFAYMLKSEFHTNSNAPDHLFLQQVGEEKVPLWSLWALKESKAGNPALDKVGNCSPYGKVLKAAPAFLPDLDTYLLIFVELYN